MANNDISLGSAYGTVELRNETEKGRKDAEKTLDKLGKSIEDKLSDIGGAFTRIGGIMTTSFTIPIVAGFGVAANAAIGFEDRLADVAKTTGLQGDALVKLGEDLRSYSRETRTSLDELLSIAEIGGQIGIAEDELISFTKAVDQFNVALGKDFAGGVEEATAQVGKIQSLFKETKDLKAADSINRIGSAVNELGAQGAGTSANITEFVLKMGQLPDAIKPSLTSSLALGTVLEEVGLDARIAGGGLTNFFLVAADSLPGFAQQLKITEESARDLLNTDPTEFLKRFAASVKDLDAVDLQKLLEDLGIGTQETIKVIGALSNNTDRLTELQKLSNTAFSEGTSLLNEYNKKNETTAAEIAKLKNNLNDIAITFGSVLLPIINDFINKLTPIIQAIVGAFQNLNPEIQKVVVAVLALVAGIGPLLLIFGVMVSTIGGLIGAFTTIGSAISVLVGFFALLGPFALVLVGAFAVLAAGVVLIAANFEKFKAVVSEIAQILKPFVDKTLQHARESFEKLQPSIKRLEESFEKMKPLLILIGAALIGMATIFAGILFAGINAAITAITQIIENMSYFLSFISNLVQVVSALLRGDFSGAWEYLKLAANDALNFFIGVFNLIFNTVKEFVSSFLGFFLELYDELVGHSIIPDLVNAVVDWIIYMANKFLDLVKTLVFGVINFFLKLPAEIGRLILQLVDYGVFLFIQFVNKVGEALMGMAGTFVRAFKNFKEAVVKGMGEVLQWGINIGKSFVDGITEGLKGLSDAVGGALDDAKGLIFGQSPPPEGPWKNIDKWGYNVGDAWATGLNLGLGNVDMPEPQISSNFTPDFSKVSGDFGGSTTNNQSISLSVPVDMYVGTPMQNRQIAEKLLDAFQDIASQRGTNLNLLTNNNG